MKASSYSFPSHSLTNFRQPQILTAWQPGTRLHQKLNSSLMDDFPNEFHIKFSSGLSGSIVLTMTYSSDLCHSARRGSHAPTRCRF